MGAKEILKMNTEPEKTKAASDENSSKTPPSMHNPLSPSKQERKRLKKLRKKATHVINDGEHSGILTQTDWLEMKSIIALANVGDGCSGIGPLVGRRKRKEANKVEASHHRDLLAWLMDRMRNPNGLIQQSGKRAGSDEDPIQNPSIPSWASIHNPGTITNIVVLEVQVPDLISVEVCQAVVDGAVMQAKGRKALHTQTKWFQGHAPKTLSDGLLYFVAPSKPYKRQKVVNGDHSPGKNGLLQDMEEMILPLDRWGAEGYPVPIADDRIPEAQNYASPEECQSTPSFQDLESISLVEAKDIVAASGFRVKGQNELDKQLYLQTLLLEEEGKGSDVRVFGLDCEMVLTSMGSELARITLIQMKSFDDDKLETTTILDALVKPENPVKDYLTRHSGITIRLLDPVTTRLQQIQVALRRFLRPSDILVGHSLENDLMAAHFVHPRVIDTSLIFRHGNKRTKFSLRHISASLLKRNIQRGSHCSEEDAVAALELAVRRAGIGDSFVLPSSDERRSVLERWTTMKEMKVASIGPPAWLQSHFTNTANGIHALGCNSVAECSKAVLAWTKGSRKLHLVWSHMDLGSGSENTLEAFQKMLIELLLQTSSTTVVAVGFQIGLEKARERLKARSAGQDPRSTMGWSAEQEHGWKLVLETSRQGLMTWISSSNHTSDE